MVLSVVLIRNSGNIRFYSYLLELAQDVPFTVPFSYLERIKILTVNCVGGTYLCIMSIFYEFTQSFMSFLCIIGFYCAL